jgi:hypothetical protein
MGPEVPEPTSDRPRDVTQELWACPALVVDDNFHATELPDAISIEAVSSRPNIVIRKDRQPRLFELMMLIGIRDTAYPIEASVAFHAADFAQGRNLVPHQVNVDTDQHSADLEPSRVATPTEPRRSSHAPEASRIRSTCSNSIGTFR